MGQIYMPKFQESRTLFIRQIVFDKSVGENDVTIFGAYKTSLSKEWQEVDYCCDFAILRDLLLHAKKKGEEILDVVADLLTEDEDETVCVVDVEYILWKPLKIDGLQLTIYKAKKEDENGDLVDVGENLYVIDKFDVLKK